MARILVVDDDPAMARAVARMLSGHVVCVVHCVRDALELHTQQPFELVIADVLMPAQSGIELHAALEARGEAHRIVFFTGASLTPEVRAFFARVSNQVIEKPCTTESFLAAVAKAIAPRENGGEP